MEEKRCFLKRRFRMLAGGLFSPTRLAITSDCSYDTPRVVSSSAQLVHLWAYRSFPREGGRRPHLSPAPVGGRPLFPGGRARQVRIVLLLCFSLVAYE